VLVVAGVPTGVLAWQWRGLDTRTPGGDWLPPSLESSRGLRSLREMERSGIVQRIRVIVELPDGVPARSPEAWEAMSRLTTVLEGNREVARVRSLPALMRGMPATLSLALAPPALVASFASADDRLALLEIMPAESPGIANAMALVRELRALDASGATGLAGARLIVGGLPAFNVDYGDRIAATTPRVVALVLGATFVALLIGFRSVLIPVKAIALNLLSVGAAFGAVVLVFQHGYGSEWLGLSEPLDGIFPAVPLLVFCTVFGLSMDYEVFLVSRVAEARRNGAGEGQSIVEGVSRTGGVITSAGLVMIVVFGAFVMSEFIFMKILGLALATAVAIDVTVIRLALGPALLRLAGRWNWWPGSVVPVILLEDKKVKSESRLIHSNIQPCPSPMRIDSQPSHSQEVIMSALKRLVSTSPRARPPE
jgi:RND superfamily putative drug exporter